MQSKKFQKFETVKANNLSHLFGGAGECTGGGFYRLWGNTFFEWKSDEINGNTTSYKDSTIKSY